MMIGKKLLDGKPKKDWLNRIINPPVLLVGFFDVTHKPDSFHSVPIPPPPFL
jgi:hypothetical protein